MRYAELSETVAVAGQIRPEDLPRIAEAGYRVVVNNRPDGEEPGQPPGEVIAAAAAEAGLEYYYMPVGHTDFPGPDFEAFVELLDEPGRPVFAYCRSGTRCANLWVASRKPAAREQAIATARASGFDVGMAQHFLAQHD